MGNIKLKIKRVRDLSPPLPLPGYQTPGSAGMDLMADIPESVVIKPGQRRLVPTGLSVEIPLGFEAQIRARSGLALKKGIGLVNAPGTIDSDYRGEIGIILINWGEEDFVINRGDRIAQMVIAPVVQAFILEEADLAESSRSAGGFGSTGV